MVVDKPAGMLVHPSGVRMDGTLIELMRAQFGPGIDLAHRLDRETSGVIVLTRTRATTREVKDAFKQRRVSKRYLALVHGCPAWDTRIADLPMGVAGAEVRVRQTIRADGAPARTLFKVVRRFSNWYALLEAAPETGRLHQIRVHLEALGLPVYGDKIYGGDGSTFLEFYRSGLTPELLGRLGHWRHALHAQRIELVHPADGRRVRFEAPLPDDLVQLMATLDAKPEHRPNEGIFASHVREGD